MIVRLGLRFIALAYLALLLIVPVGIIIAHTFSGGLAPVWDSLTTPDAVAALELTLKITLITVPLNTIFGITMALLIVRRDFRGKALLSALIDLPFAVSPVIVGFTLILVYGMNGWFGSVLHRPGLPDHLLHARDGARDDVRVAPVRRPRGDPGAARDRHRAGAGRLDARGQGVADVPPRHPARHPLGHRLRRRPDDGPLDRRVRRGRRRLRAT